MKSYLTLSIFLLSLTLLAQSKTTDALRMLNQTDDKEFDELIKDIEKMKFLMVDKDDNFKPADYTKLKSDYKSETFEEVMSTRYEGRNFDILLKEKSGKTMGMIVLVNDSSSLYVLDVVGRISLDKVTTLYSKLDESADIGKKIKNFTDRNDKRKDDDKEGKPD